MIVKQDVLYPLKKERRKLHIYLPDNYFETEERYPVVYFFDGHNAFRDEDATYGKSWGFEAFLSQWKKPIIIVGMECTHKGNERLGEYSPYTFGNDYWGHIEGVGKETMRWIVEDIKPYIDRRFRTYAFREATAIAGSSMGGLMSLYAGTQYNEIFSKLGCVSSSLDFNYSEIIQDIQNCKLDADTRFYLSWGAHEAGAGEDYSAALMTRRNNVVADILWNKGAMVFPYCQKDGGHCEADWSRQVPQMMNYLWF